ncbi:hypothetical protein ACFX2G_034982 [Malus domestica]
MKMVMKALIPQLGRFFEDDLTSNLGRLNKQQTVSQKKNSLLEVIRNTGDAHTRLLELLVSRVFKGGRVVQSPQLPFKSNPLQAETRSIWLKAIHPYPAYVEKFEYPNGFKIPDFSLFAGESSLSSLEHVA